jgi:heat shock protein HslJ
MKPILFSTAILSFVFALSYCSNNKELTSQTEALFRNKWKLTELQGQQVADPSKSSFEFTPGKISGSTGCNRLSAGFVAGKNQTIKFSPASSTKMACADEAAGTLETRFLDALTKSTKWSIKEDELWLSDGGGTLIKLKSL